MGDFWRVFILHAAPGIGVGLILVAAALGFYAPRRPRKLKPLSPEDQELLRILTRIRRPTL